MFQQKNSLKKVTPKVSEIKLVKLLIALVEKKYTVEVALCCSTFIVSVPKNNSVTTKSNLFRLVRAGLKEKKQADEYLFCFLNFIFHQPLITYNSITITLI